MRFRWLLLILTVLLSFPAALLAQDDDPFADAVEISSGDTVSAQLTEEAPAAYYRFSARAGDLVTISLSSPGDEVDTYLILNSSGGGQLVADDDGGTGRNSRIDGFPIPADGDYIIVASSYGNAVANQPRAGAIELDLLIISQSVDVPEVTEETPEVTDTPEPQPTETAEPEPTEAPEVEITSMSRTIEATEDVVAIAYGMTVDGSLTDDIPIQQFSFSANAGDTVTIDLSGDFDTLLLLRDSDGRELEVDDDGGVERNSLIEGFSIPADGDYIIEASSYDYVRQDTPVAGSYTLELNGEAGVVIEMVPPEPVAIAYGESMEGELTLSTPEALYTFNAAAGDVVTVEIDAEFDSMLFLLDAMDNELVFDDDSADDRDALIEGYEIPADGEYTIVVDSYRNNRGQGAVEGAFSLTLSEGAAPVVEEQEPTEQPETQVAEGEPIPISIGEPVTGELTDEVVSQQYIFSASSGDVVTVNLSGDFDTFLYVFDAEGNELAYDDDSGGDRGSLITDLVIPADGDYIAQADSYGNVRLNDPRGGTYTLTVTLTGSEPVTEGQPEATAEPTETPTDEPEPTEAPATTEDGDILTIEAGQTVSGELTTDIPSQAYRFAAEAGNRVTIDLQADFDAYLILQDADGNEITVDDDGGEERNSRITRYTLPEGGDYIIVASSYEYTQLDEPTAGSYTLSLAIDTAEVVTGEVEDIAYGGIVSGELTLSNPSRQYRFSASEGDVITILLEADFDGFLFLYDDNSNELAFNDDGGGDLNSLIEDFEIPADGDYIIQADSYANARLDDPRPGSFTLSLSLAGSAEPVVEETPEPDTAGDVFVLEYGDVVEGELTVENPNQYYRFHASAGDMVTINMNATFDNYLILQDADGNEIVADDDGGEGFNARITIEIPEDGDYTIIADSYGNAFTDQPRYGEFTLSLVSGESVTGGEIEIGEAADIAIGDSVTGSLTGSVPADYWTFEASEGDSITIILTSEDFDAYLQLLDANGSEISADDDGAGSLNSRVGPIDIPADGVYTVVATSYDYAFDYGSETGDYTLTISRTQVDVIEFGEAIEGRISTSQPFYVYEFTGREGDLIVIDLDTSDYNIYMTLESEFGDYYNSTYGDFEDFGPATLPADGTYVLTVSSYYPEEAAAFGLHLSRVTPETITLNTEVSGNFDDGMAVYSFEGSAGETISVVVDSGGSVDTSLRLLDSTGYLLIDDDDGGPGFDPEIFRFVLPETGTYTLALQPVVSGDNGDYSLIIETVQMASLNEGPQTVRLSDEHTQGVVVFDASGGETVALSLRARSGSTADTYVTVTQNGDTLATNNLGTAERVILEFEVPLDGEVRVLVEDYSYTPVVIELELVDLGD